MTVSARQARTRAELAPVRALVEAHVRYEQNAAAVPKDWDRRVADLTAAGRLTVFVADAGGPVIGYASMTREVSTWTGQTFAHLDCLFIDRGHRGHGIGQLLFDTSVDHARSVGDTELQWQTPTWNEGAIRFYRRAGALSTSKERFVLPLTPGTHHTGERVYR